MRTIDEIQADIDDAQEALQHAEDDLKMARQDAYDAEAQSRKCEVGLWRLLWELAEARQEMIDAAEAYGVAHVAAQRWREELDEEAGSVPRGWTELDPGTVVSEPNPDPDCKQCGGSGVKILPPGYAIEPIICGCTYMADLWRGVGDAGSKKTTTGPLTKEHSAPI